MSDLGEALPTGTITEATETVVAPTEEATPAAQPAPPPAPELQAPAPAPEVEVPAAAPEAPAPAPQVEVPAAAPQVEAPAAAETAGHAADAPTAEVSDVTQTASSTVAGAAEDTGVAAVTQSVAGAGGDAGLLAVAESITDAGGDTGPAALTYSVGSVADDARFAPVTDGIAGLGTPMATPVDTAAAPLTDGVMTVGTPLTTTMESFVTPFSDTVEVVAAPFVGTVPTSEAPDSTAPALAGEGAAALSSGDARADGSAVADHALEGAAVSATPATAHGSDVLADPAGPAFGPPLALPAAADPSAPFSAASPPVVGDHTSASAVGQPDPVAAAVPELGLGSAGHDLSATSSPATLEPLWSTSDSALATLAEVAPDPRVLVSAAVLALAGAALIGPRTGGSGTDLSMAMTNVRLLPCVVKASLERHVSMLVVAVGANGGSLQAGSSQFAPLVGSARGTGRGTGGVLGVFDNVFGSVRDGFGRVTLDARDEAEEGTGGNPLMPTIWVLLGFVHLAFLSVWFWATRARSSART